MDLSKYLEQAADAVKRRNFAMAVKIYGQVLAIQPDFGDARAGLRKALFQNNATGKLQMTDPDGTWIDVTDE